MKITFRVPCVVRGRLGRCKGLKSIITTTPVDFDVPEVYDKDVVWSYAAELGRRSDGYSQFYRHNERFYGGTLRFDCETARKGWLENPWQADTLLYQKFWYALLDDLLERGVGKGEDPNLFSLTSALSHNDIIERTNAWIGLSKDADALKRCTETEEDFEEAHQKAKRVLDDLIIYRRELVLATGQPCYAVHIKDCKAKISIESTDVHQRLREASFEHPIFYPYERSNARIESLKHYFPIEERDAMLAFVKAAGARIVGRVPKASRHKWATHDEAMHGLELDRIARITLHEISLAFGSASLFFAPAALLRERRSLFEAFYDLKAFLEQKNEPETTGEKLEQMLRRIRSEALAAQSVSGGLINRPLGEFLDHVLTRFGDRRIDPLEFFPSSGALPTAL
jgi:hypothetical protein